MLGHLVKREVNTRLTFNMICRTAGQVRHPMMMHLDCLPSNGQNIRERDYGTSAADQKAVDLEAFDKRRATTELYFTTHHEVVKPFDASFV